MRSPLVTCLCLTRNRREWLPKAIECFRLQTFVNRELLIVADGEDVSDLVPQDDARIRLVCVGARLNIGEKRNFGCDRAQGEIIAHWDDDDYSAPARLEDQVRRLQESGKAVTGYRSLKFTDGNAWWLYESASEQYALGTSLCYRRDWWMEHRFPSLQVGEDNDFVKVAARSQQLAVAPAGDLMFARIHPGNTNKKPVENSHSYRKLA